jgi:hypothetical protein
MSAAGLRTSATLEIDAATEDASSQGSNAVRLDTHVVQTRNAVGIDAWTQDGNAARAADPAQVAIIASS